MNVLGIAVTIGRFVAAEEHIVVDADGHVTTHSWWLPETAEWVWGGLASLIIFAALVKFAGPAIRKGMAARTQKIQDQLDAASAAKTAATAEAAQIRQAKGDIAAERSRIMADAEAQATAIREDSRTRLAAELADLDAKGQADIAAARGRVGDELRSEIARLSTAAVDHVVTGSLDEATHQDLIEQFISRLEAIR